MEDGGGCALPFKDHQSPGRRQEGTRGTREAPTRHGLRPTGEALVLVSVTLLPLCAVPGTY